MRFLYVIITLFLVAGCSVSTPTISEYRIDTEVASQQFLESTCRDQSLKVAQAFSPSALMTLKMNYAEGNHKQYVYSQSQWAESPNSAVTAELVKSIKGTALFKNVQISKSRSKNSMLLETNIEDFMQYFSKDEKSSFSNIVISLTLIDTQTNHVIATKTFHSKVNAQSTDASGGVIALNRALSNVLNESGKWLGETCK